MISSSLLIVGIAAVVVGVNVALALHEHQRKVGRALLITEKRMESLLLLFPGSLELSEGVHPNSGFEGFSEDGRPGGDKFRVTYTVTPEGEGSTGQRVDVSISWDERLGERSLSLTTVRD
jgi:hypothetical protein